MRDEYSCGYVSWALEQSHRAAADEERRNEIEKALRKTFRHDLIGRFEKAVVQYSLVEEGDRIAICISGGKDSMLMAKLFQELKRHNKFPFELFFVCMDPGYSPENRGIIENNARLLGIPIEFFETEIFEAVYNIEKSPCYLCARMRRGYLYRFAKDHGRNKIALGHHYDDGTSNSKRLETKKLIASLKETVPQVENNIFRATENVVLNKVLGYKIHGEKHSFLEDY